MLKGLFFRLSCASRSTRFQTLQTLGFLLFPPPLAVGIVVSFLDWNGRWWRWRCRLFGRFDLECKQACQPVSLVGIPTLRDQDLKEMTGRFEISNFLVPTIAIQIRVESWRGELIKLSEQIPRVGLYPFGDTMKSRVRSVILQCVVKYEVDIVLFVSLFQRS